MKTFIIILNFWVIYLAKFLLNCSHMQFVQHADKLSSQYLYTYLLEYLKN